jgi:hypothetical protein
MHVYIGAYMYSIVLGNRANPVRRVVAKGPFVYA